MLTVVLMFTPQGGDCGNRCPLLNLMKMRVRAMGDLWESGNPVSPFMETAVEAGDRGSRYPVSSFKPTSM